MRKFFLGAALVAASFGMAQSADAATVMDVDGVSTAYWQSAITKVLITVQWIKSK